MPGHGVLQTSSAENLNQFPVVRVIHAHVFLVACSRQVIPAAAKAHLVDLALNLRDGSQWSELRAVEDVDQKIRPARGNVTRAGVTDNVEARGRVQVEAVVDF